MREKVCIVLNEREANKQKAAELLQARLKENNITVSRLKIGPNIEEVVASRKPQVLVLDYLLGDFSTGLDVISALQRLDEPERPYTIFLTDEPSVQVAVQALRLGVKNYYELDNPQAIALVATEIIQWAKQNTDTPRPALPAWPSLDSLILRAEAAQHTVATINAALSKHCPVVVFQGKPGTGRLTLAQALQTERGSSSLCHVIDLAYYTGELGKYFPTRGRARYRLGLGNGLSLIILNADEDNGELLELVSEHHRDLWPAQGRKQNESFLTVSTTSEEVTRAWRKLGDAEVIAVPTLSQRQSDVPSLVQRFLKETHEMSGIKIEPFDADAIDWLKKAELVGNIAQLRSLVIDAAVRSSFDKRSIRELLEEALALCNEQSKEEASALSVSPYVAAAVLERCDHNFRIAAARLGLSVGRLKALIAPDMPRTGAYLGS